MYCFRYLCYNDTVFEIHENLKENSSVKSGSMIELEVPKKEGNLWLESKEISS